MKNLSILIYDNSIKLMIDDLIHVVIRQDELVGLQSWVQGDEHKTYWIEYSLKTRDIITGYDQYEKWKSILELLHSKELFTSALI